MLATRWGKLLRWFFSGIPLDRWPSRFNMGRRLAHYAYTWTTWRTFTGYCSPEQDRSR